MCRSIRKPPNLRPVSDDVFISIHEVASEWQVQHSHIRLAGLQKVGSLAYWPEFRVQERKLEAKKERNLRWSKINCADKGAMKLLKGWAAKVSATIDSIDHKI